jgi:hypothetical protein
VHGQTTVGVVRGRNSGLQRCQLIKTNHPRSGSVLTDWNGNLANINSYDEDPRLPPMAGSNIPARRGSPSKMLLQGPHLLPTLGRFQTDPIGYDDQSIYMPTSDPVNTVDPMAANGGHWDTTGSKAGELFDSAVETVKNDPASF